MDKVTAIVTVVLCLFGSGGIVLWFLNRVAKKNDARDELSKDMAYIKKKIAVIQEGMIICLENDCVIFHALKTHQINGDSEKQEKKMNDYFLSFIKPDVNK